VRFYLPPTRANRRPIKSLLPSLDAIARVFASQRENPVGRPLERARESDISPLDSFIIGRAIIVFQRVHLRLFVQYAEHEFAHKFALRRINVETCQIFSIHSGCFFEYYKIYVRYICDV